MTKKELLPSGEERTWPVPYNLEAETHQGQDLKKFIDEWDNDRIDDNVILMFMEEVAKIPVPSLDQMVDLGITDARVFHCVFVARAAVWAYEKLAAQSPDDEVIDVNLSPKVVLDSAFVWDRG